MARSMIERRIAGRAVRLTGTIGVLEAVAEIEPQMILALAAAQRAHLGIVRAVVVEGMKASGEKDAGAWFDRAVEDAGLAPLAAIAFDLLADAFTKAEEAEKKSGPDEPDEAAEMTPTADS